MIGDEVLDAAVAQGIIDQSQAARLRELARTSVSPVASEEPAADPDDEKFRLIGGFNDVFVTIGVLLLIAALSALSRTVDFDLGFSVISLASAWGLAEFFSRRMRLALPSIVLALMFAGSAAFLAADLGNMVLGLLGALPSGEAVGGRTAFNTAPMMIFAGLGAAIAARVHERRFHVPIDSAIAAAGILGAVCGVLSWLAPDWTSENWAAIVAFLGLGVFAVALRVDATDPERRTRRADVAFWLHMLAAPMIVHALIPLVTGDMTGIGTTQAIGILALFVLLGLVALVIDRRALLVSGLSYAGIAIGYLLSQSVEKALGVSLTLLGLAVVVLGLSAGWRSLRRAVLPLLPLGQLRQHIPPADPVLVP